MTWCLTPVAVDKLKKAFKDGEVDPVKLAGMESLARREFLSGYVGKENAVQVNSLFESKLLLKNQKAGYISWAKRTLGLSTPAKQDIISKIERLDKVLNPAEETQFLHDLASTRLKIDVTQEEAKNISDLSAKTTELKVKANKEGIFPTTKERMEYGASKVALEKYVNELKLKSRSVSFKEQPFKKTLDMVKEIPGVIKSVVTSLDNSFWGRQGIKVLLDFKTSPIWFKNFAKSWVDMGRELKGVDAMDLIKTDIYSRPNALNGKYTAGKYGLDVLSEEAYPSSFPERIPAFGRLFKASEVMYNGAALRLRADLADRLIKIAEKQGVNTLDPNEAVGMGRTISSMTGRGSLPLTPEQAKAANVLFFSVKFLKSNFDTLTAHQFDPKVSSFAKKESAKSLLRIIATIASILTVAKLLNKDSVDLDRQSTNFGKVKVFGHWVDITGGMGSLVILASRLTPSLHDGQWGLWTKSSTGNWTNLTAGKYGQQTAMDVFENFWEGKLAPVAGLTRDVWQGQNFQGQPVTLVNAAQNLLMPMSLQNYGQLKSDPNSASVLGSMILDMLGLSTSTYQYKSDWTTSTSKEMVQFKKKVGDTKFKEANDTYNQNYSYWYNTVSQDPKFKNLSDEGQQKLITEAKANIKDKVFKQYNFKYVPEKTTLQQTQEKGIIKKLLNFSLVRDAYAAEKQIGDQERRWYQTAMKLREEHPEWYEKNVGRAGEIAMFGFDLGSAKTNQVKPSSDVDKIVDEVWGDETDTGNYILSKENVLRGTGKEMDIPNRIDPKTGKWDNNAPIRKGKDPFTKEQIDSIDRGLFRINNITFLTWLGGKEERQMMYKAEIIDSPYLNRVGLNDTEREKIWDRMLDPKYNAKFAKLLYDHWGINQWVAVR